MAVYAENCMPLQQQIIQTLQNQKESLLRFKEQIKNKDAIVFLGHTRSGKSTLVNYCLGNKLIAWEDKKKIFKIQKDRHCEGPEIGKGSSSCTRIPHVYKISGHANKIVVDLPGFEDNGGTVQDIKNALYISQIKLAHSLKFVLVLDINDIVNDNIKNFKCLLQQTQELLYNFDTFKDSFCIICTKDFRDHTQHEVAELFANKILNEEIDTDKTLVRYFVQNESIIGIFKMPVLSGEISSDIDVNVIRAIKECRRVYVEECEITFALSAKTREALLQIYREYTDTEFFEEQVSRVMEKFADYFNTDKYVYASYNDELKRAKDNLTSITVSLLKHANEQRTELSEILVSLNQLLECRTCGEFKANFKFMIILDDYKLLEERYKSMVMINYINSLHKLCEKVNNLLKKIDAEVNEREKCKISFRLAAKSVSFATLTTVVAKLLRTQAAKIGVGVSVGLSFGIAYALHDEHYKKREQARRDQNRTV